MGIVPPIRIKKNANSRASGVGRTRGLAAQDQLCGSDPGPKRLAALDECERVQNQKDWKRRVGYGWRWLVESVFIVAQADVRRFRKRGKDGKHRPGDRNKDQHINRLLAVAREAIAGA